MKRSHLTRFAVLMGLALAFSLPTFAAAVRAPAGFSANSLAANDDGSTGAVGLGFSVNFFGAATSTVFVNNNGNVTFSNPLGTFTPNGLAVGVGQPIIAPFFADVDTRVGNLVTYGTDTVNGFAAFGVEWPAVGYFADHVDKLNTFELILINRSDTGAGNFDIEFNYNSMQWETGDASEGVNGLGGVSAVAGYSNGMSGGGNVFFQLPGSLVNGALINGGANALISNSLNSAVLGRYDFQVRGGVVVPTEPTPGGAPEPASIVLTGAGVLALGIAKFRKRAA